MATEASDRAAAFEERCLAVVLLVAGVIGLAIGVGAPRANATELVLGAMLMWLGQWTLRASIRSVRSAQENDAMTR